MSTNANGGAEMNPYSRCFFGTGVSADGTPFTFFQDHFGDDPDGEGWGLRMGEALAEWQADDYEAEELSRRTDYHDPNKIDGRRVRRHLGDKLINLGRRVNNVSSKARHW